MPAQHLCHLSAIHRVESEPRVRAVRSSKKPSGQHRVTGAGRLRFGGVCLRTYCCGALSAIAFVSAVPVPFGIAALLLPLVWRVRYSMNGVTSNGIFSRSATVPTGLAFSISSLSLQGSILTRPPSGNATMGDAAAFAFASAGAFGPAGG